MSAYIFVSWVCKDWRTFAAHRALCEFGDEDSLLLLLIWGGFALSRLAQNKAESVWLLAHELMMKIFRC